MANAVVEKIQELDVIDKDLVVVSQYITSRMRHDWYIYSIFHLVFQSFGMDGQQNAVTHSLHSVFNIFIPPQTIPAFGPSRAIFLHSTRPWDVILDKWLGKSWWIR